MGVKRKLSSRKLWITIAGILASIGSAISGVYTENETLIIVGILCTVVSTSIYTIAEAVIDASAIGREDESEG